MNESPYKKTGFLVAPKTRLTVRRYAQYLIDHVRVELGLRVTPFPITKLLELWASNCGPVAGVDRPNLDILEPAELPHAAGEFLPLLNTIRINREIWDAACDGDGEARLVVAHETGHLVLQHNAAAGLYLDQVISAERDSECQANWFGDELLMDSRLIDLKADGTAALASRFGVGEAAAARRIRELLLEARNT